MAKNLLVDIGNTSVKWTFMGSNTPLDMSQQHYPRDRSKAFFIELWRNEDKPSKVIVSCVANSDTWCAIESAVDSLWNLKTERVIAKSSGYGLINAYLVAEELGSDRWCALIGAYHTANSDIVVIDCGSAITVDVANASGQHLGGYILPGILMMKQSLGLHTAQVVVDTLTAQSDNLQPAKTTSGCVNVAVNLAAVSMIETIIKQQSQNSAHVECYLTGGDADLIAKYLTAEYVKMPDLVLRGLAVIVEDNKE